MGRPTIAPTAVQRAKAIELASYLILFVAGIVFYELFVWLRVVRDVKAVLQRTPRAIEVIASKTLSDAQKESAVRSLSVEVGLATLKFVGKIMLVIAGSTAVAWLGCMLAQMPVTSFLSFSVEWLPIVSVVVVVFVYARIRDVVASG